MSEFEEILLIACTICTIFSCFVVIPADLLTWNTFEYNDIATISVGNVPTDSYLFTFHTIIFVVFFVVTGGWLQYATHIVEVNYFWEVKTSNFFFQRTLRSNFLNLLSSCPKGNRVLEACKID